MAGSPGWPQMSQAEQEVFNEINVARTQPRIYAAYIEEEGRLVRDNKLQRPGEVPIALKEGRRAYAEAAAALQAQPGLQPLTSCPVGMVKAAKDHRRDLEPGRTGHTGSDGSTPGDRMNRHGQWEGRYCENISFGSNRPRDIVVSLLVDDGVPGRGHRKNLLTPELQVCGVAFGKHTTYGCCCVQTFAVGYSEGGTTHGAHAQPTHAPEQYSAPAGEAIVDHSSSALSRALKQQKARQHQRTAHDPFYQQHKLPVPRPLSPVTGHVAAVAPPHTHTHVPPATSHAGYQHAYSPRDDRHPTQYVTTHAPVQQVYATPVARVQPQPQQRPPGSIVTYRPQPTQTRPQLPTHSYRDPAGWHPRESPTRRPAAVPPASPAIREPPRFAPTVIERGKRVRVVNLANDVTFNGKVGTALFPERELGAWRVVIDGENGTRLMLPQNLELFPEAEYETAAQVPHVLSAPPSELVNKKVASILQTTRIKMDREPSPEPHTPEVCAAREEPTPTPHTSVVEGDVAPHEVFAPNNTFNTPQGSMPFVLQESLTRKLEDAEQQLQDAAQRETALRQEIEALKAQQASTKPLSPRHAAFPSQPSQPHLYPTPLSPVGLSGADSPRMVSGVQPFNDPQVSPVPHAQSTPFVDTTLSAGGEPVYSGRSQTRSPTMHGLPSAMQSRPLPQVPASQPPSALSRSNTMQPMRSEIPLLQVEPSGLLQLSGGRPSVAEASQPQPPGSPEGTPPPPVSQVLGVGADMSESPYVQPSGVSRPAVSATPQVLPPSAVSQVQPPSPVPQVLSPVSAAPEAITKVTPNDGISGPERPIGEYVTLVVPDVVEKVVVHCDGLYEDLGGMYRAEVERANGRTLWRQDGGEGYLFCSVGGVWTVTDDRSHFAGGAGFIAAKVVVNGKQPTALRRGEWRELREEGEWGEAVGMWVEAVPAAYVRNLAGNAPAEVRVTLDDRAAPAEGVTAERTEGGHIAVTLTLNPAETRPLVNGYVGDHSVLSSTATVTPLAAVQNRFYPTRLADAIPQWDDIGRSLTDQERILEKLRKEEAAAQIEETSKWRTLPVNG